MFPKAISNSIKMDPIDNIMVYAEKIPLMMVVKMIQLQPYDAAQLIAQQ